MAKSTKSLNPALEGAILLAIAMEQGSILRRQDGGIETWRVEVEGKQWIAEVDLGYTSATNIRPSPLD